MEFRILGPVEAYEGNLALLLGPYKQRSVLAVLLIHANEVVSTDELIDALWGESPPEGAANTLHVYISQVRKALDAGPPAAGGKRLVTRSPGYLLRVGPDELDLYRFERFVEEGRRALEDHTPDVAAVKLRRALALWRGSMLADLAYESFSQEAISRGEEMRVTALEDRIDADLSLGRHTQLIAELEGQVAAHPLRERMRGQLMLALYRSGRQAEALEVYRETQVVLRDELGIDPSPKLQRLEKAILSQDQGLEFTSPSAEEPIRVAAAEPSPAEETTEQPTVPTVARRRLLVATGVVVLLLAGVGVLLLLLRRGSQPPFPTGPNTVVAIDQVTNEVVGGVAVGRGPSGLAVVGGDIWVANVDDATVSRVDPTSDSEIARQGGVGTPTAIAAGEGAMWVIDGFGNTLSEIDPSTNEIIRSIKVHARGIAVGYGALWVTDDIGDRVLRIDPQTLQVEATIRLDVGSGPRGVAVGLGGVWVANELNRTVTWIDPTTNGLVVRRIALCCRPAGIAVGAGSVWVTSASDDKLIKIDPASRAVVLTTDVGDMPTGLAVSGGAVWVAALQGETVERIDTMGTIIARIRVDGHPISVGVCDRRIWVTIQAR